MDLNFLGLFANQKLCLTAEEVGKIDLDFWDCFGSKKILII